MARASAEMGRAETFCGYGPYAGYAFLREAIAAYYAEKGVAVSPEEIFVTDGAKGDAANLTELLDPGCAVLVPDPAYPVYRDSALLAGRKVETIECRFEDGFCALPPQKSDAEIVYLCSPNNPTGAVYTREQLCAWVQWVLARGALILFDAAYEAFVQNPALPRSIYEIPGARECSIEISSFSKTAGFTGVRCGYTVIPREMDAVHKAWLRRLSTKTNGVSYIVQHGAEAVFSAQGRAQA